MESRLFEATTVNVKQFKTLIEVLKEFIIEAPMEVVSDDYMNKKKGDDLEDDEDNDEENNDSQDEKVKDDKKGFIRITSTDQHGVLLAQVTLFARKFNVFRCRQKIFDAGISIETLHKLIKPLDNNDILTMYVDENDKQKLSFRVTNDEAKRVSEFKLKLLDINKQIISSTIKPDAKIKMNSTEFHKICKEMSSISDKVEILCTKNEIQFKCKGDSAEKITIITLDKDNIRLSPHIKNKDKAIIQGIFDLKNLSTFAKCQGFCKYVMLYLSNERELCMNYNIGAIGTINVAISPVNNEKTISDDDDYNNESEDDLEEVEIRDDI